MGKPKNVASVESGENGADEIHLFCEQSIINVERVCKSMISNTEQKTLCQNLKYSRYHLSLIFTLELKKFKIYCANEI